jgi:hypothetical protein
MRKAGEILSILFNERFEPGFLEKAKTVSGLFSSWEAVTAEAGIAAAAAHSRVAEHERGLVLIEADHPGWIQLLQTRQNDLLEALRGRYGENLEIRGIGFRLSRGPVAPISETQSAPPPGDGEPSGISRSAVSGADNSRNAVGVKSSGTEYTEIKKRLEASMKRRNHIK